MATLADMLDEVESAISAVLMGKSYSVNGRSLTRENLSELTKWRSALKTEIASADNLGGRNYAAFEDAQ
jgi:hypothetical protein